MVPSCFLSLPKVWALPLPSKAMRTFFRGFAILRKSLMYIPCACVHGCPGRQLGRHISGHVPAGLHARELVAGGAARVLRAGGGGEQRELGTLWGNRCVLPAEPYGAAESDGIQRTGGLFVGCRQVLGSALHTEITLLSLKRFWRGTCFEKCRDSNYDPG